MTASAAARRNPAAIQLQHFLFGDCLPEDLWLPLFSNPRAFFVPEATFAATDGALSNLKTDLIVCIHGECHAAVDRNLSVQNKVLKRGVLG